MRMNEMVEAGNVSRFTLMAALQDGSLHGGQRVKGGTWHVEEACFHAWMRGDECEHRQRAQR
jgi:hypothetical protein